MIQRILRARRRRRQTSAVRSALVRFLKYGLAGWCLEVAFTGAKAALVDRDRRLAGTTYLWMLPIYGTGGLLLEAVHGRLRRRRVPLALRGLAYLGVIYAAEYGSGLLLRHGVGQCPWDYTGEGLNVHGLIRLDYAPAWMLCGLGFERLPWVVGAAAR